jgi:chemotaxis protein CheX
MTPLKQPIAAGQNHQDWIPLLEIATEEVFELMLSCKLVKPATPVPDAPSHITGMVGLAGLLCGVLSVGCEEKAAALMASKMLGIELDKVGPSDIGDALGEVCNMAAGNFKNKISGLGDGCMLSPPSVITGNDYNIHSMAETPSLAITLLFENMPLRVCLQIHS